MNHGYAKTWARDRLLEHADELEAAIPKTEAAARNIGAIKRHNPPSDMSFDDLCHWVDLLARSVPETPF